MSTPLILASASPRRRELLTLLGVEHSCQAAAIDETPLNAEVPETYVSRMAQEKAQAVAQHAAGRAGAVLGADTTVVIDEDILGKPLDHLDALSMLARLSGREHRVITGLCLVRDGVLYSDMVVSAVEFVSLDRATCETYLATDEPWDKAGAYGIQGLGGAFVRAVRGSYSNVVGLPLAETRQLLVAQGIATALDGDLVP